MFSKKTNVYSIAGKNLKTITLPIVFSGNVDTKLIKRAVLSIQSGTRQPQGVKRLAGRDNTATYRGMRGLPLHSRTINTDKARLPRLKNRRHLIGGRVAGVPQAIGGPRVRVPKVEKILKEKINNKERLKAFNSALAALTDKKLILKRHKLPENLEFPIVIEDKFEETSKTKEVKNIFEQIDIYQDILSAKAKRQIRAGKGKGRGRKYKKKKSALIITSKKSALTKAAKNFEGIDITTVDSLNVELLAPGTVPGRLTVWTESAINSLGDKK